MSVYSLEDQQRRDKNFCYDESIILFINKKYRPKSIVDLGCGVGWYCEEAKKLGVVDEVI